MREITKDEIIRYLRGERGRIAEAVKAVGRSHATISLWLDGRMTSAPLERDLASYVSARSKG